MKRFLESKYDARLGGGSVYTSNFRHVGNPIAVHYEDERPTKKSKREEDYEDDSIDSMIERCVIKGRREGGLATEFVLNNYHRIFSPLKKELVSKLDRNVRGWRRMLSNRGELNTDILHNVMQCALGDSCEVMDPFWMAIAVDSCYSPLKSFNALWPRNIKQLDAVSNKLSVRMKTLGTLFDGIIRRSDGPMGYSYGVVPVIGHGHFELFCVYYRPHVEWKIYHMDSIGRTGSERCVTGDTYIEFLSWAGSIYFGCEPSKIVRHAKRVQVGFTCPAFTCLYAMCLVHPKGGYAVATKVNQDDALWFYDAMYIIMKRIEESHTDSPDNLRRDMLRDLDVFIPNSTRKNPFIPMDELEEEEEDESEVEEAEEG